MVMRRQSSIRLESSVARMSLRSEYKSLVADVCMELEAQAERSRSVSAQVTVSGMEISPAG